MPRKSRHLKELQSKRKKIRQRALATAVHQPVETKTHKPVAPAKFSAPLVSAQPPRATPNIARYPYVVAELQRIGILAGIMLVILIVLALVLS